MSTMGLVMIVRNEAHGIEATLRSALPHIDRWCILDTGSTDGTQAIIRGVLGELPGELHEGPFEDFASARNRALDLLGDQTTFSLMLDSDDRVHAEGPICIDSRSDAYLVQRRGDTSWHVPLVLRTAAKWRYRGRVHEYVCGPVGENAVSMLPGVYVTQARSARSAAASRARWERDLALLHEDLDAGVDRSRTLFYLAQTYECLDNWGRAEGHYAARVEAGGWDQETFEAKLRVARCRAKLENPWHAVMAAYLEAHAFDPTRAEPLYEIAEHYRQVDDLALCYLFASRAASLPLPKRGLFIDDEVYAWKAHDLVAISAFYLAQRTRDAAVRAAGLAAARLAIAARPDDPRLHRNLSFYLGATP
jgi:hypothetical protein